MKGVEDCNSLAGNSLTMDTSVILVSQDAADAKAIKGSKRDCINSPQLLKNKLLNTKSSAQRPLNCILLEASDDSLQKLSCLHAL